ncbi:MAG: DUF1646 family protein [Elusimicrobia bacterium]|nr:DUF1646 family protein [Elusimicrobiota bacterium]
MLELSLIIIILLVLVLPVAISAVERQLELFLFVMGIVAVSLTHALGTAPVWSGQLFKEIIKDPLPITVAVLVAGMLVWRFRQNITGAIVAAHMRVGFRLFVFLLVVTLGLVSSVITAIMAAIVLVEVVSAIGYSKQVEAKLVVLGCFSIGLGAALTPIGEPLSTICIAKLRGEPYHADFFFLLRHIGLWVMPGILAIGALAALLEPSAPHEQSQGGYREEKFETLRDIVTRAGKVYVFIAALILLGAGFKPVIDRYIIGLPTAALYWLNTISAVVDNATLTAAEISPLMHPDQLRAILLGLLIAGGMLIPGNIPNIICAGRLKIKSRDWARIGVPVGLGIMVVYFILLEVIT